MTRETIRRPERQEPSRPAPPTAPPAGILALQRGAGNQAVSAWLARQVAPALPAIADGLKHFRAGKARIAALTSSPAPALDPTAPDIAAALAWVTEVSDTLSGLSSPSELIFESTVVTGYDAEYGAAEQATKDMLAVVEPRAREFGTRLRDAIVASMNHSSVVDHAQNPELGTLDQATALRQHATALAGLDTMLGLKDAAVAWEDAALALLQARSVNEARTTWRANTLHSTEPGQVENSHRAQTEVDDVFADSGWDPRQTLKSPTKADDWCGMFAAANMFRGAAFDKQLRLAFAHTDNVNNFFRYAGGASDRTPLSIWAEGQWWDLKTYHDYRGLPRTFKEGPDAGYDIRPGDIVLIRHGGNKPADAMADHIVMVESYDSATGILTSIEGNVTSGVKPGADGRAERTTTGDLKYTGVNKDHSESMIEQRDMNDEHSDDWHTSTVQGPGGKYQTSGHKTVWLVGRPSLIDFEQHDYGRDHVPDRYKHMSPDQIRAAGHPEILQRTFSTESKPNDPYHRRVGH